jgi:hypothetical protein
VGAAVGAASGGGEPVVETRRERRAREAGVAAVSVPMIEEDPDIEVAIGDDPDAPVVADRERVEDEAIAEPGSGSEPGGDEVEAFVPESVIAADAADEPAGADAEQSDAGSDASDEAADTADAQVPEAPAAEPAETAEAASEESGEATGTGADEENPGRDGDQH